MFTTTKQLTKLANEVSELQANMHMLIREVYKQSTVINQASQDMETLNKRIERLESQI